MNEIYLVYSVGDDGIMHVIRAYRERSDAVAFVSDCRAFHMRRPSISAGETAMRNWLTGHPAGSLAYYAKTFELGTMELR